MNLSFRHRFDFVGSRSYIPSSYLNLHISTARHEFVVSLWVVWLCILWALRGTPALEVLHAIRIHAQNGAASILVILLQFAWLYSLDLDQTQLDFRFQIFLRFMFLWETLRLSTTYIPNLYQLQVAI